MRDDEEAEAGRRPFAGEPNLDEDPELCLDGEPFTGELVVEDFADEDVDTLVDCDLSTLDSRLSNLSLSLQPPSLIGEVGVGDFDESA